MAKRGSGGVRGLAGKAFNLQKRTSGGVPGEIMRSARLVMEGRGTEQDAQTLRNYFGVTRGSARAIRQATAQANAMMGRLAQFSAFATSMGDGNMMGVAGLAGMGFQQVEQLTRSPAFQRALENATFRVLGNPAIGSKLNYAIRRGAATGAALAGSAGLALEGGLMFKSMLDQHRSKGSKELQALQLEGRLLAADPHASPLARRYNTAAALNRQISEKMSALPFFGEPMAHVLKRTAHGMNVTDSQVARRRMNLAVQENGLSQNEFAAIFNKQLAKAKSEANPLTFASTTNQKAFVGTTSAIEDSRKLLAMFHDAAEKRSFAMAKVYQQEAEAMAPGSTGLWNAPEIYKQRQAASAADKMWAKSQSMRAGPRTGE